MPKREKHTCPRRAENGMDRDDSPLRGAGRDLDLWIKRKGYRACSYCGSMHPEDFMERARTGAAELGPTDKSYKVYVEDPTITYRPKSWRYEDGKRTLVEKYPRTIAQLKFYFQHLTDAQMYEFVDLYNARPRRQYSESGTFEIVRDGGGKMAVGFPGYFYVTPFFMGRG